MLTPRALTGILALALLASVCSGQQLEQQQPNEPLIASESSPVQQQHQQQQNAGLKQVLTELVVNAYQLGQASKAYLDTQPEFTQAWADFPYAPSYLPVSFRNSHTPYQQQQSNYKAQGGASNPNSIGYGYIDWSGPVNPASLYVPVSLPYYYRVPPQSPFYLPQQAVYQPVVGPVVKPAVYQQVQQQQLKPAVYSNKQVYSTPVVAAKY